MALDSGKTTQGVDKSYEALISKFGNELTALESRADDVEKALMPSLGLEKSRKIGQAVLLMQEEKLELKAGYDGQYGEVGLPKN